MYEAPYDQREDQLNRLKEGMGTEIPLDFDEKVKFMGFTKMEWMAAAVAGVIPGLAVGTLIVTFIVSPTTLFFIKTVLHSEHRGKWRRQMHTYGWTIKGMIPSHPKKTLYRVVANSDD